MRAPLAAIVFLVFTSALAWGQTAPKPGPEIQKLGYYVGSWEGHGETKAGPFGPAGKLSSTNHCAWFAGGFQVVCRGEEHGPTGTRSFMAIKSYDETAHSYTEYSISDRGESEYDRGATLVGNTLSCLIEQNAGGKPAKFRYTEVHVSPDLYTYKTDVSVAGGPWTVLATGEIKRVK
jgi:hypothetical protein